MMVRRGSKADIVMSSIKHNSLWRGMERFNLVRNMRSLPLGCFSSATVDYPPSAVFRTP